MSYYPNPYQPTPTPPRSKSSRSIILFLLVPISCIALLAVTPIARFYLKRLYDEFEVDAPDFSKLVFLFFPEFLAFVVLFGVLLLEFVVPSGLVRNILNGAALAFIAFWAFVIACGLLLPMLKIVNSMN